MFHSGEIKWRMCIKLAWFRGQNHFPVSYSIDLLFFLQSCQNVVFVNCEFHCCGRNMHPRSKFQNEGSTRNGCRQNVDIVLMLLFVFTQTGVGVTVNTIHIAGNLGRGFDILVNSR